MPSNIKKTSAACRATETEMKKKGIRIRKIVLPTIMGIVIAATGFSYAQVRARTFKDAGDLKSYSQFYKDGDALADDSLGEFLKVEGVAYELENKVDVDDKYDGINTTDITTLVNELFETSLDLVKAKIAKTTGCREITDIEINYVEGNVKNIMVFNGRWREFSIEARQIDSEIINYLNKCAVFKAFLDGNNLSSFSSVAEFSKVAGICREMGVLVKDMVDYNLVYNKDTKLLSIGVIEPATKISGEPVNEDDNVSSDYKKGIDVSYCQAEIDYESVSQKVDFVGVRFADYAILKEHGFPTAEYWDTVTDWDSVDWDSIYDKCHEGLDDKLIDHVNGFGEKVLMLYSFTNATTVNEAKAEAYFLLHSLKKLDIKTIPLIYYDMELKRYFTLNNRGESVQMCLEFCKIIEDAGYFAGLYTSESYVNNLLAAKDGNRLASYNIWVANWKYSGDFNFQDITRSTPSYKNGACLGINQVTEQGEILGINGTNGLSHPVDFDIMDGYLYDYAIDLRDTLTSGKTR